MDERRTLTVSVVTPEGAAYEGTAASVVVPAFDGEMAFHPSHAPFVGVLGHGELRVTPTGGGATAYFYLAGGVVQVADDVVAILAERVEPTSALDPAAAQTRLAEALSTPASGDAEIDDRLVRIDDARARIRAAAAAAKRGELTASEVLEQPVE